MGAWVLLGAASVAGRVLAQAPPLPEVDTTDYSLLGDTLAEATVRGPVVYLGSYPSDLAVVLEEQVGYDQLGRFGSDNLTAAANRIPGVRIESRAPGSYRVLLRGTGRRSPFGVRDVRTYWNGLMLTEPSGGHAPQLRRPRQRRPPHRRQGALRRDGGQPPRRGAPPRDHGTDGRGRRGPSRQLRTARGPRGAWASARGPRKCA